MALRNIAPGETLFKETGPVFSKPSMHSVQIGRELHCEISGEGRFVAHSFSPNVRLQLFPDAANSGGYPVEFRALTAIAQGEQLSFDYTTTEWSLENDGFVDHATGKPVRGFKYLSDERRRELLAAGLLPAHILELWIADQLLPPEN